MVEIVVSTAILGAVATIALPTVRQLYHSQLDSADLAQANVLARDLIDEILVQDYRDPPDDDGSDGGNTTRDAFNSIDDYANWNQSGSLPPKSKGGTPIPVGEGWIRQASIEFLNPVDLTQVLTVDYGIKQIKVRVSRLGNTLVNLKAIVTDY